jgi:hypothetical protein
MRLPPVHCSPVPKPLQEMNAQRAQLALIDQDCQRLVNPDYMRPFASLDDAVDRLLPYHVSRCLLRRVFTQQLSTGIPCESGSNGFPRSLFKDL